MSDQYQSMEDLLWSDDWLQDEQPFWARASTSPNTTDKAAWCHLPEIGSPLSLDEKALRKRAGANASNILTEPASWCPQPDPGSLLPAEAQAHSKRAGDSASKVPIDPALRYLLPELGAPFDEDPVYSLSMYSGPFEAGASNTLSVQSALKTPTDNSNVEIGVGLHGAHSGTLPHPSGSVSTKYGQGDDTPSGTLIGSGYSNHKSSEKATERMPWNKLKYPKTTCASCDAPLDSSEQLLNIKNCDIYCTRTRAADHFPLACGLSFCGLKFRDLEELRKHSDMSHHQTFCCAVSGCEEPLFDYHVLWHFIASHGHLKYYCAQCGQGFKSLSMLDNHASRSLHVAYVCEYPGCGSESARICDLNRHLLTHKINVPRHPCPHCRSYRGNNGFKRKDHLRQHIRNYHRIEAETMGYICNHADCKDYYSPPKVFSTLEQLTDHMLNDHHSSAYVCQLDGCDRVGLNGFENDKLQKLHLKKDHPSPFQCQHPGCDRVGTKGWMRERDMVRHIKKSHGINE